MLKYTDTAVTLREIPDEITLCINISNCPCQCKGCHSSYLAGDIGKLLTPKALHELITSNKGITCVAFMGGDASPADLNILAQIVHAKGLLSAWYSGRQELPGEIELKYFDYIKLGPYIEELGGLDNPNTNQRLYEVCRLSKLPEEFLLKDITDKFWKERP